MAAYISPSYEVLAARIQANYELATQKLLFGTHEIEVQFPADPDPLLDAFLAKGETDPEVMDERIPYWADVWPSAVGMAQYLSKHPDLVSRKSVLEIGCGIALPSILAAKLGGQVCMSDYLAGALDMALYNWWNNGLPTPTARLLDWRQPPADLQAEIILASDVIYESRDLESLADVFLTFCTPGRTILWSEPGRPLGESFRKTLLQRGAQVKEVSEEVQLKASATHIRIFEVQITKD